MGLRPGERDFFLKQFAIESYIYNHHTYIYIYHCDGQSSEGQSSTAPGVGASIASELDFEAN